MKFLCPQCKAKYKIADDKVAGRSAPRMKCRKCGHVIDIRSAVAVPEDDDDLDGERTSRTSIPPPPGVRASRTSVPPPPPRAPRPGFSSPVKTAPRAASSETAATGRRPASVVAAPPARRAPTPAPRPRGGLAAAATAADIVRTPVPPASPPKSTVPRVERRIGSAPRAAAAPQSSREPVALQLTPSSPESEPATTPLASPQPVPDGHGFDEDAPTVIKDIAALSAAFSDALGGEDGGAPTSVADEWFVGIDGSPVGPLTTDDIKRRAREGKVTAESLVWKEGFEDWKPLGSFPDLLALLEEARQSAAAPPTVIVEQPQPPPPAPPVTTASADLTDFPVDFKKRSGTPKAAWAAIIVAVLFGITIGLVLREKEREEVVKYVEVPAKTDKKDEPEEAPKPAVLEEATIAAEETTPGNRPAAKTAPKPAATDTTAKGGGLLAGLNGVQTSGPHAAAGSQGSTSGGSGQLDSSAIQRTVSNYVPSVRRSCWEPALAARSRDAPSSARVMVSIVVAPSGTVQSATANGDPRGYPSLARCIESKVRAWKFPRASTQTTVNVPFVFAAQ